MVLRLLFDVLIFFVSHYSWQLPLNTDFQIEQAILRLKDFIDYKTWYFPSILIPVCSGVRSWFNPYLSTREKMTNDFSRYIFSDFKISLYDKSSLRYPETWVFDGPINSRTLDDGPSSSSVRLTLTFYQILFMYNLMPDFTAGIQQEWIF